MFKLQIKFFLVLTAFVAVCHNYVHAEQVNNLDDQKKGNAATAGAEVENWVLSAIVDKNVYFVGERINLSLSLKNMGKDKFSLFKPPSLRNYDIVVVRTPDQKIPLSLYGQQMTNSFTGRGGPSVLILPGEEIKSSFHLNRAYDLTLSGSYKVYVTTKVPKRERATETATVTSNNIELTIKDIL